MSVVRRLEIVASMRLRSPMVLRGVEDFIAGKRLPLDALTSLLGP